LPSSARLFRCGHARTPTNTSVLRDASVRGGLTRTCKRCRRAASRRYGRTRKGHARQTRYRRTLKGRAAGLRQVGAKNDRGLPVTAEDLAKELRRTRGRCALCGKPGRRGDRLVVDHDHRTGRVRA
jgi:hypothetical protein